MYFTRLVLYIHFVTTTRANSQKLVVFLRKNAFFLFLFIFIYLVLRILVKDHQCRCSNQFKTRVINKEKRIQKQICF